MIEVYWVLSFVAVYKNINRQVPEWNDGLFIRGVHLLV